MHTTCEGDDDGAGPSLFGSESSDLQSLVAAVPRPAASQTTTAVDACIGRVLDELTDRLPTPEGSEGGASHGLLTRLRQLCRHLSSVFVQQSKDRTRGRFHGVELQDAQGIQVRWIVP